jgi:predicted porin
MQKKLLAVAVAGALGVPAIALAQNATVNIYGRFYAEYSKVFQGNSNNLAPGGAPLVDVDLLQNPGSAIGFRGEEKLGGGLSAWFQCETTADWRGQSTEGWCSRNSALGLKGGFGNLFLGVWDTPFKRVGDAVGANDTGIFGSAQILAGQSTTTNAGAASGGTFRRRQRDSVNYDTPNFGGFQLSGAFTTLNPQTSTVNSSTGSKPRVWSLSAKYANGPINVYGAYETHKDVTGATGAGDDKGWLVGGSFTFANQLKVGGLFTQQKFERQVAGPLRLVEGKVNAYHLGIDWMISGPHGVRAAWSHAGNVKGTGFPGFAAAGTSGGPPYRPAFNAAGGTSADLYQIRYVHRLSKRTELTAGYVKIKNKRNAAYQLYGTLNNAVGNDPSAVALAFDHRF